MSAKELLDAATPLPWWRDGANVIYHAGVSVTVGDTYRPENADLIVYAVNRLPDYEAAVEALERSMSRMLKAADTGTRLWIAQILDEEGAEPALRRLRDEVPA